MPDNSFRNYLNGKPVRHKFMTIEELNAEHPGAVDVAKYVRKEKTKECGIFLEGFGIVTAAVFMDYRLRPMDKLVYVALKLFSGKDGHAYVKQETIRQATNLGELAVRQSIKNLIQCGYVQYLTSHDKRGRRTRHEYICFDNPKDFDENKYYPIKGKYDGEQVEHKLKAGNWGRVSKAIFCDDNLDKYAKLVYAALCVLGRGDMAFRGKNAYIAAMIGNISREHIQRGLKQLADRGYISIYRMQWRSKYAINIWPKEMPYPRMFLFNDVFKSLGFIKEHRDNRISDVSSFIQEDVTVKQMSSIANELAKAERLALYDVRKREPDDNSAEDVLDYVEEKPAAEKKPKEVSDELKQLLEKCLQEDAAKPDMDYGRKYQREIDLTAPKTDYQWALSGLYQRYLYEATEDEKYLTQLIFNGGIPADCAMPGNEKKFLRCLDFLMAPVPGIHTAMEDKCLNQSIESLRDMAAGKRPYRINGEKVNKLDLIVSLNRVLSNDDGGVSMAGFLQYVSKHTAKKMLCGDVQHFKTSIVHMMEAACNTESRVKPVEESSKEYSRFQMGKPSIWHVGRSCWALGASIA